MRLIRGFINGECYHGSDLLLSSEWLFCWS